MPLNDYIRYYYTTFGEVFSGIKVHVPKFNRYVILIQRDKYKEYLKLENENKTLKTIKEYGWVLSKDIIEKELNNNEFNLPEKHQKVISFNHKFDYKTLFIIGAGASANCVFGEDKNEFEKDELRPPLGPGLFNKRFKTYYEKYEGVKRSLYYLQGEENPDIEVLFEKEWKSIYNENNQDLLNRHINIQYYVQKILAEVSKKVNTEYYATNYFAKLADYLQQTYTSNKRVNKNTEKIKKFAFISFNQDTILESFISKYFNRPIKSIDDYVNIDDSPFCIFKPHGSSNWGWKFPDTSSFNGNTPDWLFENNISYYKLYYELLGDYINMVDSRSWSQNSSIQKNNLGKHNVDKSKIQIINEDGQNNFFPAILLPYRDKDEFTMPLYHFDVMRAYFEKVETIIIIGWKGKEDAFNILLEKRGKKINKIVIVDPNFKDVIKNINPILTKNNIEPIVYSTIKEFVEKGLEKELI